MPKTALTLLLALLYLGCNENFTVDAEKRNTNNSALCFGDFEKRLATCVRVADQCPRSLVLEDDSCLQTPCNNNLYYNGEYCTLQPPEEEESNALYSNTTLNIPAFIDLCTSVAWDTAQTYTNLGVIYLGFQNDDLFGEKDSTTLSASGENCTIAQKYIFDEKTISVKFPYKGLIDMTPLQAFEYAQNVKELIINVAPGVAMACPLSDTSRCKFIPFSDPIIRGLSIN